MAMPEAVVMETLQGFSKNSDKWPCPRHVKVFVSSAFNDYNEERRQLLEIVGPELQSTYDDRQIEIELVDMQYGCSETEAEEPHILQDHLQEIRICHKTSRACFFLWLSSSESYTSQPVLPYKIPSAEFEGILKQCQTLKRDDALLKEWYVKDGGDYSMQKTKGWELTVDREKIFEERKLVQETIGKCIEGLLEKCDLSSAEAERYGKLLRSPMEIHCQTALELLEASKEGQKEALAVMRDWANPKDSPEKTSEGILANMAKKRLAKLKARLEEALPEDNVIYIKAPWREGDADPEESGQANYLAELRDEVRGALERLIDKDLSGEPDSGKGRKKTIQEVFQEHLTHMTLFKDHLARQKLDKDPLLDIAKKIKDTMKAHYSSPSKHAPTLIYGPHSSGKTTILTHLYESCETLFKKPVLRIVRFSAATPRSAYNLELLRVACQQISIILKIPEGYLPKDASFDPLYINNWFQSLLRRCEDMYNEILIIFVDNIHKVNPLECDIVNGLSWVPMALPKNVFFICTSSVPIEQLQFTAAQKDKFRTSGCYHQLTTGSLVDNAEKCLDQMEGRFGREAFARLARYITCAEFGLTETELLELLMPTSNSEAVITLDDGNFNFSTLCAAKRQMDDVLIDKWMSGKLVCVWRSASIAEASRRRYLSAQEQLRTAHHEVANLFFSQFEDSDETPSDASEPGGDKENGDAVPEAADAEAGDDVGTPFQSTRKATAPFTQRHVEESWLHLLLAGDFTRLKDLTICNFDFLHAAVQTVTISYLRCILEHVRCYILDRDIELVYSTVRKSSDILTRDHMQLGAQVISWLRPAIMKPHSALDVLVTAAMAWCDGYTKPLMVPLNGWLQPPISHTVKVLQVSGGVRLLELAPTGQHLLIAPSTGDPQLWHIMSNSLVHTFKGHSGQVLCMAVTKESQYLLTGSEDTTIIVWDLQTLTIKMKIKEHIAAVLSIACVVSKSLVVSGGEDSAIIVTSLADGALIMKLDHHRGPVTNVKAIQDGDVLVSCSQDGTVCVWSTETFELLNTIHSTNRSPIHMMDLSQDSVFLVTLEGDNEIRLRTFITGTDLHTLKKQKAPVSCMCVAKDCARLVVGLRLGGALIHEMHTGRALRVLSAPQPSGLTALLVTDNDDFLFAAGANRVTVYSFHTEDSLTNFRPTKPRKLKSTPSTSLVNRLLHEQSLILPISCLDASADGQLAASGCAQGLVRIWQMNTHTLQSILRGHTGHVTCVKFSINNLLVISGSEDKTLMVWTVADSTHTLTYKGHSAGIQTLTVLQDSRRIASADTAGNLHLWLADSGIQLQNWDYACSSVLVTNNMKFAASTNGENSVRVWSLSREDDRWNVCHAEAVTCIALSTDSLYLITGSKDMSLKVWQVNGGKLAQVLVGHTDIVSCVAVSMLNKTQVISGSWDCNLIVWDINTGSDVHLLSGHLGKVTCVRVSGDGTIAVSGAEDKTLIVWETKRGLALTSLQLHVPMLKFEMGTDCSRIAVLLLDRGCLPIICLHNTPATYVKMPTYAAPKEVDDLRPLAPKRPMKRLLKKEVSLDTYTWQKKYGHLTSSAMMAQVDERLKRRFSVSASMEEISKIQQEKSKELGSQSGLGPEQAALAQSQHFDQLEALWNKISPPRRRSNKSSLSKQSSLIETRYDSSDEENTAEEEHMVD